MLVKAARDHSSGGDVTGENGPATEPEPVTYTLSSSSTRYRQHLDVVRQH